MTGDSTRSLPPAERGLARRFASLSASLAILAGCAGHEPADATPPPATSGPVEVVIDPPAKAAKSAGALAEAAPVATPSASAVPTPVEPAAGATTSAAGLPLPDPPPGMHVQHHDDGTCWVWPRPSPLDPGPLVQVRCPPANAASSSGTPSK